MSDAILTARSVIVARRRNPLFLLGIVAAATGAVHIADLAVSAALAGVAVMTPLDTPSV